MKHLVLRFLLAFLNVLSKLDYDCITVAKDALDCVFRVHKTVILHEYCAYHSKHLKNQKCSIFLILCTWLLVNMAFETFCNLKKCLRYLRQQIFSCNF